MPSLQKRLELMRDYARRMQPIDPTTHLAMIRQAADLALADLAACQTARKNGREYWLVPKHEAVRDA